MSQVGESLSGRAGPACLPRQAEPASWSTGTGLPRGLQPDGLTWNAAPLRRRSGLRAPDADAFRSCCRSAEYAVVFLTCCRPRISQPRCAAGAIKHAATGNGADGAQAVPKPLPTPVSEVPRQAPKNPCENNGGFGSKWPDQIDLVGTGVSRPGRGGPRLPESPCQALRKSALRDSGQCAACPCW